MTGPDIDVRLGDRACHRCDQPLLLAVRVPHSFKRSDGGTVEGFRTVPLCSTCDREDPDTQGVLAFFAVHERLDASNVISGGALIQQWIDAVLSRPLPDVDELAQDHPDDE